MKPLILCAGGSHIVHSIMADATGQVGQEIHHLHWATSEIVFSPLSPPSIH